MTGIATRLRLPPWLQDVFLAGFVVLFQIRGTRLVATGPDVATLAEPYFLGYVLLTLSGLALLARRRLPTATFAVVAADSIVYYTAGYPDGPGWVALFVAVYTLTAHGDGQRSVSIVAASMVLLTVVWLITADLQPLRAAGWVFFRIGAAIMAAALGESVRGRRVVATEAQRRAELAEQHKEDEARRRVDAERLRIAREVHDTVAHAISVINVQAGVTAYVLNRRPEQARETLLTIEQTSARALRELRATLGMLRDIDDDNRAPPPGLNRLDELTTIARQAGLDVMVKMAEQPREPPPDAVSHAAYRIVQESLTNVIRHAGHQTRVTISITYGPTDLEIDVADDGADSPAHTPGGASRGILGMRERCELLGGQLTAAPRPGGGFRVQARLPMLPDEAVTP